MVDENNVCSSLLFDDILYCSIRDKVMCTCNRVNKDSKLINIILSPSRWQFLYVIRLNDYSVLQTTCKFIKLNLDEDVTDISLRMDNFI